MGYELHISRGKSWAENKGRHIGTEEWLNLVEADTELALDGRNGPYFAVWSGSGREDGSWFDWAGGNISTKHPDRETLAKMLRIAERLGATVQGDEGETYGSIADYPESLLLERTEIGHESRLLPYERRERLWNLVFLGIVILLIIATNWFGLW